MGNKGPVKDVQPDFSCAKLKSVSLYCICSGYATMLLLFGWYSCCSSPASTRLYKLLLSKRGSMVEHVQRGHKPGSGTVCMAGFWLLWKERNARMFEGVSHSVTEQWLNVRLGNG